MSELEKAKELMCEWLEKFYADGQRISYQHLRGVTRQGSDLVSMPPEYAPDGREAVIFHNCGDVAGLLGLLRESGFGA